MQIKAGEHPSSDGGTRRDCHRRPVSPARGKDEFGLGGHVKREVEAHPGGGLPGRSVSPQAINSGSIGLPTRIVRRVSADHPFVASFPDRDFEGRRARFSWPGSGILAPTATSVCRLGSDGRRRWSISVPAIRLNPINRTSTSPFVISWIVRKPSHSRYGEALVRKASMTAVACVSAIRPYGCRPTTPPTARLNPVSGWSTTAVMTWGLLMTLGEDLSGDPLSDGRRRRNHRQAKSAKGLSVANGSTLRYWTSS